MIFATEAGAGSGAHDYPNGNRKERKRPVGAQKEQKSFEEAVNVIADALEADDQSRPYLPRTTANTQTNLKHLANERRILSALKMLEAFVDDSGWMKKRTVSFEKQRLDYPPELPLPALLDWVYIDDRWPKDMEGNAEFDEQTDPMTADLPLLAIGTGTADEPERGSD